MSEGRESRVGFWKIGDFVVEDEGRCGVDLAEMGDGFVKEETHLGLNLGKENAGAIWDVSDVGVLHLV
ncbi:unnamed protein product [Dovyalis caffra]|uniref:Uncharacterized protein n=1 Tax=Dovyalis caffra TaxID=77055 RepID=A0AAV1RPM0_9ROSI|nr:unnamed protein product [Dovyalis caffra]